MATTQAEKLLSYIIIRKSPIQESFLHKLMQCTPSNLPDSAILLSPSSGCSYAPPCYYPGDLQVQTRTWPL